MNRLGFGLRLAVFTAALLSAVAALAQQPAVTPQAGPIPQAILAAKKVFVSNVGPDTEDMSA
ncbi:MAG: hypothetical protein ABSB60_01540 [Terracidiphilus sp.]